MTRRRGGAPTPRSRARPRSQARVAAHELSHFLGLQHVVNRTTTGEIIPDPIPDTEPGRRNLMESGGGGSVITPGQAFVLKSSALLAPN